jgi:hypothetical protein
MSFDTTFDYTSVTKGLTEEKSLIDKKLAELTAERDLLKSATAYVDTPAVVNRLIQLGIEIDRETKMSQAAAAVLAEIVDVTALSAEKKADLYYFYNIVDASKQDFMSKILFNYDAALNDEKIAALRADNTTNSAAKVLVAKLLYQGYVLIPDKIPMIMAVYRYVR